MKRVIAIYLFFILFVSEINGQNCVAPTNFRVEQSVVGNATCFFWSSTDTFGLFTVEIRPIGSLFWHRNPVNGLSFFAGYLMPCTRYEARVVKTCNGQFFISNTINFKTNGCRSVCTYPTDFIAIQFLPGYNFMPFWWNANGLDTFEFAYRTRLDTAWRSELTTSSGRVFSSTHPGCVVYEGKIRKKCLQNTFSDWSPIQRVSTFCYDSACATVPNVKLSDLGISWDRGTYPLQNFIVEYWQENNPNSIRTIRGVNAPPTVTLATIIPRCERYKVHVGRICNQDTLWSPVYTFNNCAGFCPMQATNFRVTATTPTQFRVDWESRGVFQPNLTYVVSARSSVGGKSIQVNFLGESGSFFIDELTPCVDYQLTFVAPCSQSKIAFASTDCPNLCNTPYVFDMKIHPNRVFQVLGEIPNDTVEVLISNLDPISHQADTIIKGLALEGSTYFKPCSRYMGRLRKVCGTSASAWTLPYRIYRYDESPAKTLSIDSIDTTSVRIRWSKQCPYGYQYFIRLDNKLTGTSQDYKTDDTSIVIRNLACGFYTMTFIDSDPIQRFAYANTNDWIIRDFGIGTCGSYCLPPALRNVYNNINQDTVVSSNILTFGLYSNNERVIYVRNASIPNAPIRAYAASSAFGSSIDVFASDLGMVSCNYYRIEVRHNCMPAGEWKSYRIYYRDYQNSCPTPLSKIVENNKMSELKIFPNPTTENDFNLNYELKDVGEVAVSVLNMQGQIVYQKKLGLQFVGEQHEKIHFENNLPIGFYIVQLSINGRLACYQKWIKI
ncbi:MAG: hypothetical protein RL757_632 [Bacteroidota bacterium]|jgi:hypothetical protein